MDDSTERCEHPRRIIEVFEDRNSQNDVELTALFVEALQVTDDTMNARWTASLTRAVDEIDCLLETSLRSSLHHLGDVK
jgi:hypothetical protein